MSINIAVYEPNIILKSKIYSVIENELNFNLIKTPFNLTNIRAIIKKYDVNVLLFDIDDIDYNKMGEIKKTITDLEIGIVVIASYPENVFNALSLGAIDYLKKPSVEPPLLTDIFFRRMKSIVRMVSFSSKHSHTTNVSIYNSKPNDSLVSKKIITFSKSKKIIAIGASTGGTEAILSVVRNLPKTCPAVLITQHMPTKFTKLYAERLNSLCKMEVKEVENMDLVESGHIYLAEGGKQMTLHKDSKGYYLRSKSGEPVSGHIPSVDVLFNSIANLKGRDAIGVLLTGMGSDGAKGLKKMHDNGSFTIGQDEQTSIVYGMPKVAYDIGAVDIQLPINEIGNAIISHLK